MRQRRPLRQRCASGQARAARSAGLVVERSIACVRSRTLMGTPDPAPHDTGSLCASSGDMECYNAGVWRRGYSALPRCRGHLYVNVLSRGLSCSTSVSCAHARPGRISQTTVTARLLRLTGDKIAFYNEHGALRLRQVFAPEKIALQLVGQAMTRDHGARRAARDRGRHDRCLRHLGQAGLGAAG